MSKQSFWINDRKVFFSCLTLLLTHLNCRFEENFKQPDFRVNRFSFCWFLFFVVVVVGHEMQAKGLNYNSTCRCVTLYTMFLYDEYVDNKLSASRFILRNRNNSIKFSRPCHVWKWKLTHLFHVTVFFFSLSRYFFLAHFWFFFNRLFLFVLTRFFLLDEKEIFLRHTLHFYWRVCLKKSLW